MEQRKDFLRRSVAHLQNVEVDAYGGLLADYFDKSGADVIVKGIRAISDFEYEFQLAQINHTLCERARTVFLPADVRYTFLSSSVVRQVGTLGGDISGLVPACVLDDVIQGLANRRKQAND
jgi:pantetheine-phosphate adenylyltransferase